MKRSGTTTTFVLVCIAVLLASYGIGLGIRGIRFRNADSQTPVSKTPAPTQALPRGQTTTAADSSQSSRPDATFFGEGRNADGTQDEGMGRMRDRSGGGRRRGGMDFENLSDEERAAMEEQRQQMMERFQNMTDEERSQFRGGRGGRGGRSRVDIVEGENDSGAENNDSGTEMNDVQSGESDTGSGENNTQSQENNSDPGNNGSE